MTRSRYTPSFCAVLAALSVTIPLPIRSAEPTGTGKLPPAETRAIDYTKDVKPILSAHCFSCHAGAKQKGGLKLDSSAAVLAGGDSGKSIVLGQSAGSKLIHVVAGTDADYKMPPEGPPLTAAQVSLLRAWVDQGAKYDGTQASGTVDARVKHWSFQPIQRPAVPANANAIDHFVRTKLAKEKLAPSPEADRPTLIRRLHLDLLGLPPTPKEVDDFVKDPSPSAYEKLVDRLLASPHHGERWGRHWLDAARYADSDGYEKDTGRPNAWRFRDWVIKALNADMPFDQFTIEQLAGDLVPNATIEQKTATGFHRNTLTNKEGGVDMEEFRVAACVDRVNTTGQVWLGLTVGCCQCHDHKYDPLTQREFYQFFAYFNSDREVDIPAPLPKENAALLQQQAAFEAERVKLQEMIEEAQANQVPKAEVVKLQATLAIHMKKVPPGSKAPTLALGKTRPTHVMIRGDFLRKGVEVNPATPAVLKGQTPPVESGDQGTRLDLAKWLVSPDNTLTARVTANWAWSRFFGRGIVSTLEDFGTQGQKPTHPELLDWLADEFRSPKGCGWSLKKLHKLIVTSATYRQTSAPRPDLLEKDPLNTLLARQSRIRLEAEIVRDGALAASGLLTRTIGGPSIRPPQPAGISELTYANGAKWTETTGADRYKRGMYVWFQRTSPFPMLMTFDTPDSNVCTVRRERSNTPLQALTLMNDTNFVECAQSLSRRAIMDVKGGTTEQRLAYAFRLCLGRQPSMAEQARLESLLKELTTLAEKSPVESAKLVGPYKLPVSSPAEAAAWVAVARAILNLDEFVTRE